MTRKFGRGGTLNLAATSCKPTANEHHASHRVDRAPDETKEVNFQDFPVLDSTRRHGAKRGHTHFKTGEVV